MITLQIIAKQNALSFMNLRNGDNTFCWFYSNKKFTLQEVENWIEKLDSNKDLVYVAHNNKLIIGTCSIYNIDYELSRAEVGRIITSEDCRGQGFGSLMLQELIKIAKQKELKTLYAYIKFDNIASQKTFEKVNFKQKQNIPEKGFYYELVL